MKVIVLSDTHGQLSYINKLAALHNADAIIHCGDFGFMSHDRTQKLSSRELSLNIKHWPHLPMETRRKAWDYTEKEKIEIINEHLALGEFDEYLEGSKKFDVPVYAVWGNHEDSTVIGELIENPIENLTLLSSTPTQLLDSEITLFGVGGNINLKKFFKNPLSVDHAPFMTFQEWAEIRQNIKQYKINNNNTWMVTHLSPGKEPLLELFGLYLKPHMWFSGHMGAPLTQHYSLFTFLDDPDIINRLDVHLDIVSREFKKWKNEVLNWFKFKEFVDNNREYDFTELMYKSNQIINYKKDSFEYKRITSNLSNYFKALKSNQPFISSYPDISTFNMIEGNEVLLESPVDIGEKNKAANNYYGRKPAKHVKGTFFWNLPDVYIGGYMIIDTDRENKNWQDESRYSISTHGFLR